MGFLSFISRAAGSGMIGSVTSRIDATIHPNLYYKERDVIIINRMRHFYVEFFKDRPIPDFLRYEHEPFIQARPGDETYIVTETPKQPKVKYQPKCGFASIHEMTGRSIVNNGADEIGRHCMQAISAIYDYLNALNTHTNGKETDSTLDRVLNSYGHRNDAVRVVFMLLVDAFTEFSAVKFKR